jgi:hypothetical protein
MARSFTHYRAGETLGHNEEGRPLDHTAGNDFTNRGVKVGYSIYVVNILRGELSLTVVLQLASSCSQMSKRMHASAMSLGLRRNTSS